MYCSNFMNSKFKLPGIGNIHTRKSKDKLTGQMEGHDLPSVLSIYPWIFLCVFIVYRRILRILCLLLYSAICWCVLVTFVWLSVLAKWLAIERPLWGHLNMVRRLPPHSPGGRECLYVFFFVFFCVAMCSPTPALHNIYWIVLASDRWSDSK